MEPSPNVPTSALVEKLLSYEELFDNVLEKAIIVDGRVSAENTAACRLVCKDWHMLTTKVLVENKDALFHFRIHDEDADNSTEGIGEDVEMPVQQFVESVAGNMYQGEGVPQHTLHVQYSLSVEVNNQRFSDCLTYCGDGLVKLTLQLSDEHTSLTLGKGLSLRKLQKFTVNLQNVADSNGATNKQVDIVRSILAGAQHLKSFELVCMDHANSAPEQLDNLVLPSTVTYLDIHCTHRNCKVDVLLKDPPPKMKSLLLNVNTASFQNGVLTRVLETVKSTLEVLIIGGERSGHKRPATFRLPAMNKLQLLQMDTPFLEPEWHSTGMDTMVPSLKKMELTWQTAPMLRKWTVGSRFESVTWVVASLAQENVNDVKENLKDVDDNKRDIAYRMTNLDAVTMPIFASAFGNVATLEIRVCGAPLQRDFGLLMTMIKLTSLTIVVVDGLDQVRSSDTYDALFLGVPEWMVAFMRKSPRLWKTIPEDMTPTSIRNLKNLETLTLDSYDVDPDFSFISDLSLEFAFLKMARLRTLNLFQSFSASPQMTQLWRRQGRFITTSLDEDVNDD